MCPFETLDGACDSVIAAIQRGIPLARVELLDELQMRACNIYSKLALAETPTLFFEFHGSRGAVDEQVSDVRGDRRATMAAAISNGPQGPRSARGSGRRGTTPPSPRMALRPGAERAGQPTSACRSRASPNASCATKDDLARSGLLAPIVGHVGDGNFHVAGAVRPR